MHADGETGRRHATAAAIDLSLPRAAGAPGMARAATRELCDQLGVDDGRGQTLLVLVSEVVTNAVKHSDGPPDTAISFRAAQVSPQAVRVDVMDGGSGFRPMPRDPSRPDGGWGLYLVDRESEGWGVDSSRGTRVWFVFRMAAEP